jgi:hypothetical protein
MILLVVEVVAADLRAITLERVRLCIFTTTGSSIGSVATNPSSSDDQAGKEGEGHWEPWGFSSGVHGKRSWRSLVGKRGPWGRAAAAMWWEVARCVHDNLFGRVPRLGRAHRSPLGHVERVW